jgi:uncharacterized membrane protein YagU involved in acid resistance
MKEIKRKLAWGVVTSSAIMVVTAFVYVLITEVWPDIKPLLTSTITVSAETVKGVLIGLLSLSVVVCWFLLMKWAEKVLSE